jgi:hypothetical protein
MFQSHIEELEDEIPEPPLPPMRMDVLGLKHDEIMTKVHSMDYYSGVIESHMWKYKLC